jgi:hypothetical protein
MSKLSRAKAMIGKVIELSYGRVMRIDRVVVGDGKDLSPPDSGMVGCKGLFLYGLIATLEATSDAQSSLPTKYGYVFTHSGLRYTFMDMVLAEKTLQNWVDSEAMQGRKYPPSNLKPLNQNPTSMTPP